MSLQKAGGINIDNTVSPASASALIDHLETHLASAGWTIESGAGTDAIKFQSALTPEGMQIIILTSVSGSDVGLELRNATESAQGAAGNIRLDVEDGNEWRLLANKYAFCLYEDTTPGPLFTADAKKWALAGTAHVPVHETAKCRQVGFLFGDHRSTTLSDRNESLRTKPTLEGTVANYSLLYNNRVLDLNGDTAGTIRPGDPAFLYPGYAVVDSVAYSGAATKASRWESGHMPGGDALLAWSRDPNTLVRTIRCQLYDTVLLPDPDLAQGQLIDIDGDRFRCFTAQGKTNTGVRVPYALAWYIGPTP